MKKILLCLISLFIFANAVLAAEHPESFYEEATVLVPSLILDTQKFKSIKVQNITFIQHQYNAVVSIDIDAETYSGKIEHIKHNETLEAGHGYYNKTLKVKDLYKNSKEK
ncbi:hypothetical protein IJ818_02145 [bacterium]|nr:hypothetical protein [bacterium]